MEKQIKEIKVEIVNADSNELNKKVANKLAKNGKKNGYERFLKIDETTIVNDKEKNSSRYFEYASPLDEETKEILGKENIDEELENLRSEYKKVTDNIKLFDHLIEAGQKLTEKEEIEYNDSISKKGKLEGQIDKVSDAKHAEEISVKKVVENLAIAARKYNEILQQSLKIESECDKLSEDMNKTTDEDEKKQISNELAIKSEEGKKLNEECKKDLSVYQDSLEQAKKYEVKLGMSSKEKILTGVLVGTGLVALGSVGIYASTHNFDKINDATDLAKKDIVPSNSGVTVNSGTKATVTNNNGTNGSNSTTDNVPVAVDDLSNSQIEKITYDDFLVSKAALSQALEEMCNETGMELADSRSVSAFIALSNIANLNDDARETLLQNNNISSVGTEALRNSNPTLDVSTQLIANAVNNREGRGKIIDISKVIYDENGKVVTAEGAYLDANNDIYDYDGNKIGSNGRQFNIIVDEKARALVGSFVNTCIEIERFGLTRTSTDAEVVAHRDEARKIYHNIALYAGMAEADTRTGDVSPYGQMSMYDSSSNTYAANQIYVHTILRTFLDFGYITSDEYDMICNDNAMYTGTLTHEYDMTCGEYVQQKTY